LLALRCRLDVGPYHRGVKIAVIGGGPAGLYFSLLMKKARPDSEVTVVERNRADDTFGWGVVFSNETLGHFREADAETLQRITAAFARWDNIDTYFKGEVIRSGATASAGSPGVACCRSCRSAARSWG
jgi:anthraniloyl-CoA monooxygenase